ncbi:uncharacterized protein Z519_06114 [Cladophialophora bantiana CBS 173.52]|uniref:Alpha/beta hydrolase fold-3 domain-containing protein n=1 Tax=Cladophialophora bantiana (strain ATCC 10958 / CBS 173.52 / CDC B-1940 / NIH 8579) TaxID=1442370 RepID=A0A0D2I9S4_CLAB1|nr:uncharacterized protein Z519_06114 [Cladophialophora bantiana CBS 173.52]KIW93509.1 hypothetical protein Z519_06114 [Cladophialophora bantiana CBS 173.52]
MFHRRPAPQSLDQIRLARRQAERQLVATLGPLHGDLEEFYTFVPLPDGHRGELKVVRHKLGAQSQAFTLGSVDAAAAGTGSNGNSDRPFIVLFHGGGFSNGSVDYMTRPARDFAIEFNAVVVSATYRLAPEYPFPVPMQDAWDTLVWLSQHAREFGANPQQGFVVGGVSAGGTMAAVLTQLAQDRGLTPPLTGAFVSIPLLLVKEIVPEKYKKEWTSMEDNKNNPSLNRDTIRNIIRTLDPDVRSPLFSPFNSRNPHVGLPPTYVHVGGMDVLRDDGLVYERALRDNGVQTRCDIFPDLGHVAWTIYATEYSRLRLGPKMTGAMRWLLSREGSNRV